MTDRLLLLASSPRLPAGLLSWHGWQAARSAPVYATAAAPQVEALRAAGVPVELLQPAQPRLLAREFRDRARASGAAVWLAGPDGDPQFTRALGDLVAREGGAELEVVYGSWDPPGARLLDVVAVMDRLRSPGGCPWDAEQTHASLMPYLLEEAYEAYHALEEDDDEALREELGDVLLQVAFHARIAAEAEPAEDAWTIDDIAADLVDKLVRRHPHVFADATVDDAADVHARWDRIKTAEKSRTSVTEGVPLSQPALTLAATLVRRATKIGVPDDLLAATGPGSQLGRQLFALVVEAGRTGQDAEVALRTVARVLRDRLAAVERAAQAEGRDPATLSPDQWRARWAAGERAAP